MSFQKVTGRELREFEAMDMTAAQVARAIGVSRAAISYHVRKAEALGAPLRFADGNTRMKGRGIRVTLPDALLERLDKYTANSVERVRSVIVAHAVGEFLRERGV